MKKLLFILLVVSFQLSAQYEPLTQTFQKVSDLSLQIGRPSASYSVTNYANPGDGGGGTFYWDDTSTATTVTGMIYSVPGVTVGRWKRKYDGFVNVLWFGMKADYSTITGTGTDNLQALKDAIAGMPPFLNSTGGPKGNLFIPRGNYYISDTVSLRSPVAIIGDGTGTFLYFASGKDGFIVNRSNTPAGQPAGTGTGEGTVFRNLNIYQKLPILRGNAIVAHAPANVFDCKFQDWGGCAMYINSGAVTASTYNRVRSIMMNVQGLYTVAPDVTLTGVGTGAHATAILGGSIASIVITDGGREFYTPPIIQVGKVGENITEDSIETFGYGANATAIMGLDTIKAVATGSGYTTATVTVTGSTGSFVSDPAEVEATVGEGGQLSSLTIIYPGSGYGAGTGTAVIITDPTGIGTGATATATVVGGAIATVTLVDSGQNYSDAGVDVDITGSSIRPNAHATAVISGGQVVSYVLTDPGNGYASAGDANITVTGDGTGATATATLKVVSAKITSIGGQYEYNPVLYFRGGRHNTGTNAAGYAVRNTTLAVKRVRVDSTGGGYTSPPAVVFSGGAGSGAIATAILYKQRLGNANRCKVKNVNIVNCAYGVWTEGSDVNAGTFEGINITNCRFWAVHEGSFLGNLWTGLICQGNKGAYMATSNTGYGTTFLNCYSEGGQLPSVGVRPAKLWGGDHGAKIAGTWVDPEGATTFGQVSTTNGQAATYGGNVNNGELTKYWNTTIGETLAARYFMSPATGSLHLNYGSNTTGDATNEAYQITGPYTGQFFGKSVRQPYSMYIDKLRVGSNSANGRLITNGTSMPSSGEYAQGDLVLNSSPDAGSTTFGWLRLVTGTTHVSGTDWMTLASAQAGAGTPLYNNTIPTDGSFYLYNTNSTLANYPGLTKPSINHAALDIVTRSADGYHAALNIYNEGATSGLHLGSIASGGGFIAGGGYRVSSGTYWALGTAMSSFTVGTAGFTFQGISGATTGTEVALNSLGRFTVDGKLGVGTVTPSKTLDIVGTGNFSDTLTATTMGLSDSSNRVASTKWVKQQVYGSGSSANAVLNNQANSYTAGMKQTFAANGTNAGVGFGGGISADPSSLVTGDFWYRSDILKFKYYDGTTARFIVSEALAQTLTNKTMSTGSVWNGTALTSTYLPATIPYTDQANTYTAGMKQIFVPSATTAGLNFSGLTGDPSSLSNGDMWHNNVSTGAFKYRIGTVTRTFANLDEAQTFTNKTLTSPVINTPTGIVKGDVGLGNVDNTSDATKNSATATLSGKTLTTPIIASISNTGTFTIPTVTGTAVQFADAAITSSATPSPTGNARINWLDITALAADATIAAPSGTLANHNELYIRVKDNATIRNLTWNAVFRASPDMPLPAVTVVSKTLYLKFVYNSTDSKWDLLAALNNF